MPHWPEPWGRGAGAVEQVVIDELLAAAEVTRPHIGIGAWALPPIISRGTPEQRERWVDATLMGTFTGVSCFRSRGRAPTWPACPPGPCPSRGAGP